MKKAVFIIILFLLTGKALVAQQEKYLQYEISGEVNKSELLGFADSLQRQVGIQVIFQDLYASGYLGAAEFSRKIKGDTLSLKIVTGAIFNWVDLRKGNLEPVLLIQAGYDEKRFENKPFQYQEIVKLFDKILSQSENEGFPFAAMKLDSLSRNEDGFSAALNIDLGPYITFDTLKISGNSKTKRMYLAKFLQILPGEPFSQRKIEQAISQIKNLPYLRWAGEPEISFQNEEATLYLPINDRKINTLDGIIGFLPNEFEENKLLITGQFDLGLYNVGGNGRNYNLNWQRLSQYSQNLRVGAIEPMVFGSMIDIGASFYLLKEDTTFLNRDFRLDFGYRFKSDSYIKFFGRRQSGDLLATSNLREIQELPDFADFRYNNYGVSYQLTKLDDIVMPRRGFYGHAEFAIGNKEILENTGLPPVVYEGLERRTIQYYIKGDVLKHFYFNNNWGLMTKASGGILVNENLLGNDLYRLGGLRTIRGFNENFFFANNYIYFSVEPRFYFDTYSYFMIFVDTGRLENRVQGLQTDFPLSTGLGFSLETSGGIFNFIYALGMSNSQDFALNLSKIHFGYTGRF
ncbi:outer membrane protein/protective antigen OMA87 [Belliella baltica DSM 15883]|uniref:Outer membrane protein/protective antigen OMA87 n=1 Tax=Belliella baltica (strain DSM 15883 / CIP 108006 / LMG 21964 / BA134) TaxID=866536 RepID=I3Z259_BELBD|nr:POTRA domain-containing protein [Belliella baltica]AFL83327.1 outer membrane protein/protective antigen OMA87 [Belliella baltica DSM 15883]